MVSAGKRGYADFNIREVFLTKYCLVLSYVIQFLNVFEGAAKEAFRNIVFGVPRTRYYNQRSEPEMYYSFVFKHT